jgi:hypothetical protein
MSFSFNVRGTAAEGSKVTPAIKAVFERTIRELRRIKGLNVEGGWGESADVDGRAEFQVADAK